MKKNIVVFASGSGTNFINIFKFIEKNNIDAKIVLLISNNPKCGAIRFAKSNHIDIKIINDYRYPDLLKKNKEYELVLKYYKTDLILLAGFMKKVPQNIVDLYKNKMMNIHPSLLPQYGGQGFYGMHVHEAVIEAKEEYSGATVHFVNNEYDQGSIIIQKKIKVIKSESATDLAERVLKIEHLIYPEAIKIYLNKLKVN